VSAFNWTDRHGKEHHLEAPNAIDDEAEEIATEIDACFARAREGSPDEVGTIREQIRQLLTRHNKLAEDAERWNEFALHKAKAAAHRLVTEICDFLEKLGPMMLRTALHEECAEELSDPATRAELLDGPMTDLQRDAIEYSQIEPKPPKDATRGEALEWLASDPALFRPFSDEGGWFEWQDADGVIHRLVSPLRIEQESVLIAASLDELVTELTEKLIPNGSLEDLTHELESANSLVARLHVLQRDLERFAREEEDEEWKRVENEWTQFRSAPQ
jgi:hypothetical protein